MAYNQDKRPFEFASKSNHTHLIRDVEIQGFLNNCSIPYSRDAIELDDRFLHDVNYEVDDKIKFIVAVDGGDATIPVKDKFPSSTMTFFQFGANLLSIEDLAGLKKTAFIDPEDISKLKELDRIKLALPTKNLAKKNAEKGKATLSFFVRETLYSFFKKQGYLATLKWFLFEEYKSTPEETYVISTNPDDEEGKKFVINRQNDITEDYRVKTEKGSFFLTDVFRLHEAIDEDLGANGIIAYVRNLVEHFILIHTIKGLYEQRKETVQNVIFIKDGVLAFFGQTANMHNPMRNLLNFLSSNNINVNLVGVEKSGAFVEHALEIKERLSGGQYFLLSNNYIYKYIKPGDPNTSEPFGRTSYYSCKLFFKTRDEKIYVLTLPSISKETVLNPQKEDFPNVDKILRHIELLKSDMYDNSLLPIALANKLVSISDHPSSSILEKFAKKSIINL